MRKESIYHRINSEYCYALSKDFFILRIKTVKQDCSEVFIHYTDKYAFLHGNKALQKKKMDKAFSDFYFDYYEIKLEFHGIAMAYYFSLESLQETVFYGNYRIHQEIPAKIPQYFIIPAPLEEDLFIIPDWAHDAVIYQIFPDRFFRGENDVDHSFFDDWHSPPKNDSHFGGNLRGITEKLPYLFELGINTLYLTPVFTSSSNHKYNIEDYFEIDPQFGTKEDLKQLVCKAHNLGMKVILDAVLNHSGTDFFAFQDLLTQQENSVYRHWFDVYSFPVSIEQNPNYKGFAHSQHMPKLNLHCKEAAEYFLHFCLYWIKEVDIDGWRLDVADEVAHSFWKEVRKRIRQVKADVLIIGEIWYDSSAWLQGDELDTVMNYQFYDAVVDFIAKNTLTPSDFGAQLGQTRSWYRNDVHNVLWNLLGSHDTARFLTKSNEDLRKQKLAASILLTFSGSPMIYYGDELGMTGGHDPDCRKGMWWHIDYLNSDIFQYFKKLISIRKNNEEFQRGDMQVYCIDDNKGIFSYLRKTDTSISLVIINNYESDALVPLPFSGIDLINNCTEQKETILKGKTVKIIKKIP